MVFQPQSGEFTTHLGPIFANLVLADEINRAPAKVQSGLLEAMQEHQVTIGGESHALPCPFLVMATQNPVEQEGTYPLPEAQVDRFLFKLIVDYPSATDERAMMKRWGQVTEAPQLQPVSSASELLELREASDKIHVSDELEGYMLAPGARDSRTCSRWRGRYRRTGAVLWGVAASFAGAPAILKSAGLHSRCGFCDPGDRSGSLSGCHATSRWTDLRVRGRGDDSRPDS